MPSLIPENLEELVAEYKRIRPLVPKLHGAMRPLIDNKAIKTCGKRLRLYSKQGNKLGLNFANEHEIDMFQDYLLYMYRPRGFNLVQQMRNRKRYAQGSDEQMLLEGMSQARFSLFWVKELHQAGGLVVLDVITGQELFLLDQSMPQQDIVGLLIALRIFPFRNAWMHTGVDMVFGTIEDCQGLKPLGRSLNDKEEQELNEKNFFRWQAIGRDQA